MNRPQFESDTHDFAAWNEEMVRRYDIERYYERSHALIRWLERTRLRLILRLAAPNPGDRVLEVGCGAGHVLHQFSDQRCTGVDLSPTMLARSRRRLGPQVSLIQASAEALPLAAQGFDIVLCTEVLEHTREPRAVIAELLRVAAPGARVVVTIPNERNIDRAKRAVKRVPGARRLLRSLADEGNEWHLHSFDSAHLKRVTEGLADIRTIRGIPHNALPLRWVAVLSPGSLNGV